MDDLKEALKLRWRITRNGEDKYGDEEDEDAEGEGALSANNAKRCGGKGHTAATCWKELTKKDFASKRGGRNDYKAKGGKKSSKSSGT